MTMNKSTKGFCETKGCKGERAIYQRLCVNCIMQREMNNITDDDVEFFTEMRDGDNLDVGTNTLDLYQKIAIGSAFYPGQGTPLGLIYCALKLNGEAGELAEHVGKAMRDDGLIEHTGGSKGSGIGADNWVSDIYSSGALAAERQELIEKEIGDVLWYLSAICNELGMNLSDAALKNLIKLADRQQRGKLPGSGDNR